MRNRTAKCKKSRMIVHIPRIQESQKIRGLAEIGAIWPDKINTNEHPHHALVFSLG
jgi:hypothetical protein